MKLLDKLMELSPLIGNTPIRSIQTKDVNCYIKLEYNNFSGSIKDRAVFNILYEGIKAGRITETTRLVESSSGNFAISIASICNYIGLDFIGVIDPNINQSYEELLGLLAHKIVKVSDRDETGGYLLNRIREVQRLCAEDPDAYWTDQYENPHNFEAYINGMGNEIGKQVAALDYAFVAVSSCGTITGLSRKLKELYPNIKIVGVDIEGSLVFQNVPKRRFISGIGSSKRPNVLAHAQIDSVINISHTDIIKGCWDLLKNQSLFVGGSTGAMYAAINQYIDYGKILPNQNVLFLCCDKGTAYIDTIYNRAWIEKIEKTNLVSVN